MNGMLSDKAAASQWLDGICEDINVPALSPQCSELLLPSVQIEVIRIIERSWQLKRRMKSARLTVDHLNYALQMSEQPKLYGLVRRQPTWGLKPIAFSKDIPTTTTATSQDVPSSSSSSSTATSTTVPVAPRKRASHEDLVALSSAPLPRPPEPYHVTAHWSAMGGEQPPAANNPKQHRDPKTFPMNSPPGAQEFFDKTTKILLALNPDPSRVTVALAAMASDPDIQQLVPFYSSIIYKHVSRKKGRSLGRLDVLLDAITALLCNQNAQLDASLPQLMPAVFTCVVAKELSPGSSSVDQDCATALFQDSLPMGVREGIATGDFNTLADVLVTVAPQPPPGALSVKERLFYALPPWQGGSWSLRRKAAAVVALLVRRLTPSAPDLIARTCRTYLDALADDKTLGSVFGGIAGLAALSNDAIRTVLLPQLSALTNRFTAVQQEFKLVQKSLRRTTILATVLAGEEGEGEEENETDGAGTGTTSLVRRKDLGLLGAEANNGGTTMTTVRHVAPATTAIGGPNPNPNPNPSTTAGAGTGTSDAGAGADAEKKANANAFGVAICRSLLTQTLARYYRQTGSTLTGIQQPVVLSVGSGMAEPLSGTHGALLRPKFYSSRE